MASRRPASRRAATSSERSRAARLRREAVARGKLSRANRAWLTKYETDRGLYKASPPRVSATKSDRDYATRLRRKSNLTREQKRWLAGYERQHGSQRKRGKRKTTAAHDAKLIAIAMSEAVGVEITLDDFVTLTQDEIAEMDSDDFPRGYCVWTVRSKPGKPGAARANYRYDEYVGGVWGDPILPANDSGRRCAIQAMFLIEKPRQEPEEVWLTVSSMTYDWLNAGLTAISNIERYFELPYVEQMIAVNVLVTP